MGGAVEDDEWKGGEAMNVRTWARRLWNGRWRWRSVAMTADATIGDEGAALGSGDDGARGTWRRWVGELAGQKGIYGAAGCTLGCREGCGRVGVGGGKGMRGNCRVCRMWCSD